MSGSPAFKAWTIAAVVLRRLFQDRTTLFFTVLAPVIVIAIIGSATGNFQTRRIPLGLTGGGRGELARELRSGLTGLERADVSTFADERELRRAVRRGTLAAGVVIPRDYDELMRNGRLARIEFVADQTRAAPEGLRSMVAAVVARQSSVVQAARFATARTGVPFERAEAAARQLSRAGGGVSVRSEPVGRSRDASLVGGFNYQAPSNLVLFVFITSVAASAATLIEARRLGVTRRMMSTPTRLRTVLAGETLGRFAVALIQAVIIVVAGRLIFGVDWGNPAGAALLILLFVLVSTSVAMLIATVFRTPEQVSAVGPPLGIALGMLGGCMWPLEIVPPLMRSFGHLFPHAWAMDAWIELVGRGGGVGDIALQLSVLAGFAAVLLPLSVWRLRRAIAG